ncbi:MAG: MFS transporter [Luteitalea sp.]|nr:MFS transporter [Luteitalea sp.]
MATTTTAEARHPRGLYVLFGTEMWERFSFYTVNGMLVLYVTNAVQGFGLTNAQAATLSSWYQAFIYLTPLAGGFLADRFLGYRRAITIGGVFFMAGHALLAVPNSLPIFYLALTCLFVGNGFFKPNVSSMVGSLYAEGSHLKDKAYLIFYMGINVGAFLAPVVAEYMRTRHGFHPAFFMGAIGMAVSLTIFWANQKHVRHADRVGRRGDLTPADRSFAGHEGAGATEQISPAMAEKAAAMAAVPEWKRLFALVVIFAIVIVFWMIFHQNSITLTLWANDHTDWNVTGILSNAINPAWIVVLSLPLVAFWNFLDRRGLEPSTPVKMTIGMLLTGLSFTILFFAARAGGFTEPAFRVVQLGSGDDPQAWVTISPEARAHLGISRPGTRISVMSERDSQFIETEAWPVTNVGSEPLVLRGFARLDRTDGRELFVSAAHRVSPLWLIIAYGVLSLGELMLSPMGLSLVSQVAPVRMRGLMMGGWFLATAMGNKLTAIGRFWDLWSHAEFFIILASMALAMAIVLLAILRPLKRAMPGV